MTKYFIFIPFLIIAAIFVVPKLGSKGSMMTINDTSSSTLDSMDAPEKQEYSGEKGQSVEIINGQLVINTSDFEVNKVKFFNTTISGKTVYFLVLKDKDGNFRAAANANQKCAAFGKGYRQVGDELECLTCNKKYPLSDFAIEKPDCNPFPINAKLPVTNNQIIISLTEISGITNLF